MNGKKLLGMALLTAGLTATAHKAAAADLWLHIDVDGKGDDQANINLPLSMVRSMAGNMIHDEGHGSRSLRLKDKDISISELRQAWRELQNSPDTNYITVRDKDSDVRIGKKGDYLHLRAVDHGEKGENVEAKIPLAVVAALLSGSGDELNVGAALEALVRRGEGELLTVNGDDETVRIWIDSRSDRR